MGLFGRRIKNPVEGTAQVVACSNHSGEGVYENCRLQLVVQTPSLAPYPVEVHQLCPRSKWPQPGMTVPVVVSEDDPQRVKVNFKAMDKNADTARTMAERQAAAMRGEVHPPAPPGAAAGPGGASIQFVGGTAEDIPPERRAMVEGMLGIDLDGDGVIGAAVPPPPAAPLAGSSTHQADRLGQLERLVDLMNSGALTEAEFAAEKARILGS
ncbi:MAG: SHOCT domain-containing protein [Microthrixaceae bacterium]